MKRFVKCSSDFDHWYRCLSPESQKEFKDFAEHNVMDIDTASEFELEWLMRSFNAQQEEALLDSEALLDEVKIWAAGRTKGFSKFEKGLLYLEKHSIPSMVNNYIKYFNQNIAEGGNGFDSDWDSDDTMDILYRNGKIRTISPDWDDGTRKINIGDIDSIILNGSWGTAFAGPHITFEDYTQYEDIPDIRVEFDK